MLSSGINNSPQSLVYRMQNRAAGDWPKIPPEDRRDAAAAISSSSVEISRLHSLTPTGRILRHCNPFLRQSSLQPVSREVQGSHRIRHRQRSAALKQAAIDFVKVPSGTTSQNTPSNVGCYPSQVFRQASAAPEQSACARCRRASYRLRLLFSCTDGGATTCKRLSERTSKPLASLLALFLIGCSYSK